MSICFTVYCEPDTQGELLKKEIASNLAEANRNKLIKGPISLEMRIFTALPLNIAKCQRTRAYAERGMIRPLAKPHVEYYVELITHVLHSLVDKKHSQVVDLRVYKFYSENPRVEVIMNKIIDHTSSYGKGGCQIEQAKATINHG
ncbi:RusA family crossover junction endodeoxyribonuclease [Bacillus sp. NPDC077027]|uniref:RusA family crossover junction endodeoxyribonuclease n=1 Tax=Bacillus sp. NPDC077027 TaxID=3390548 RepID=UPI003CFDAFA8